MGTHNQDRAQRIRSMVSDFLQSRCQEKLKSLTADDPERDAVEAKFQFSQWLEDAARRVAQLQAVTHSLKPLHPDARGTSLYCVPKSLPELEQVGTYCLSHSYDIDVVGNAAALDVFKFLKLRLDDQTLLSMVEENDADMAGALSDDPAQASKLMSAFASITKPRGTVTTHVLAKQVYWLVGDDPHEDANYHLLCPLYPSSLVHRVFQTIQSDRFDEAAKASREAKKNNQWHERPVREYRSLAVLMLGGTKPQNISQLNSERGGKNFLLSSMPPVWKSSKVRPLLGAVSMFTHFGRILAVRALVKDLRNFLESKAKSDSDSRSHRDSLLNVLIDELIQFSAGLWTLEPGWSSAPDCALARTHKAWADPLNSNDQWDETVTSVAADFAAWLNVQLRQTLPVGDPEFAHWRKLANEQLWLATPPGKGDL